MDRPTRQLLGGRQKSIRTRQAILLAQLLIEQLASWQETCKQSSVVSLPTFAAIAPAASAETQSFFPMLCQGSSTQGVSNGNSTPQNETNSSVIGNALSWDSQRQMLVELSSIETIQVESLASPAGSLNALTSTDAYRFQPAGSGFVVISSNTPNSAAVPVPAAPIKDAAAQFTVPSSPTVAQSILDMQAVPVPQADLRPNQVTETRTESPGEPVTATQASTRKIFSWASFFTSKPLDEAHGPASGQNSSPLSASSPEQQTSYLLSSSNSPADSSQIGRAAIPPIVSASPVADASATGSGLDLTSGLDSATTSPIVGTRATQAASVLPALAIAGNATSPAATPKAKRNLPADTKDKTPLLDQVGLPGESFLPFADPAPFQGGTVKAASQPARSAINADTPPLSTGSSPAISPTPIGGGTGLLAADAPPRMSSTTFHSSSPCDRRIRLLPTGRRYPPILAMMRVRPAQPCRLVPSYRVRHPLPRDRIPKLPSPSMVAPARSPSGTVRIPRTWGLPTCRHNQQVRPGRWLRPLKYFPRPWRHTRCSDRRLPPQVFRRDRR